MLEADSIKPRAESQSGRTASLYISGELDDGDKLFLASFAFCPLLSSDAKKVGKAGTSEGLYDS